jgi:hypothetical protein
VRRILGGVAAAVLALTAVPALAEGTDVAVEPEVLAACTLPVGATALTPNGFTGTVTTPSFIVGNEREDKVFVLDLAGLPVGTTGSVDATMTWDVAANDYDLEIVAGRTGGISENAQPFDPRRGERRRRQPRALREGHGDRDRLPRARAGRHARPRHRRDHQGPA